MTLASRRWSKTNPYLVFLPFLALYIALILLTAKPAFQSDESRYYDLATNLTKGFFSPPAPHIYLWSGPGYPLVLAPFVYLKVPLIAPRLLNAIFLYFAVIFFFKTLSLYVKNPWPYAVLLGLYWPFFSLLPLLMTETFALFLVAWFLFRACLLFSQKSDALSDKLIPGCLLALLALTKPIFGYVILICLAIFAGVYMARKSWNPKTAVTIFMTALAFCFPYLLYTYSLTHEVFYWASSGGMSLYTMSSPYKNESGDWFYRGEFKDNPELVKNHKPFFVKIAKLSQLEKDTAYRREALKNIREHPGKYFLNWLANIGRLLFAYPFSYSGQSLKTYSVMIPNMFIVVFSAIFVYPTIILRKRVPYEILLLLTFVGIYLFGSSLLSAFVRQFYIMLPIIGLWLAYMISNFVRLEFDQKEGRPHH